MNKVFSNLRFVIIFILLFGGPGITNAQEKMTRTLSLKEVIDLAKSQSPMAKLASTQFKNKYWSYKNYLSNYRPQLSLNGTLPDLNSSISAVTQPDGSEIFRRRSLANSSLDVSLSQNLGLTGGEVFLSSQIQRIDLFSAPKSTTYLASPAVIGIRQPLFRFNELKWDRKIEPLKFEESKKQYNEEMEAVSIKASEYFFNLLLAQMKLKIEKQNVMNTDTLFKISKGRFNLGKIAENDLLQMELSLMNARNNLSQANLDVDLSTLQLRTFLKLTGQDNILLIEPTLIPTFDIDENIALAEAKKNRQQVIAFQRQRLEAEREVARARGESRLNANLFATYGLTQSASLIPDLYENPQDQQRANFTFQMPIMDWGRAKSRIRTAQANLELVTTNIEQDEQNFSQAVILLVKQFKMYREKLVIAAKSDTIAQKRYDIAVKRYLIGKIGITDLNIALQEKDQAKLSFVQSLRNFWDSYFEIRRKTLFDFENNAPIHYNQN